MLPATRYAQLAGLGIAYQSFGSEGRDLVLSAGGFNHVDVLWEDTPSAVYFRRLASFARLIRFDLLGAGGSDRWPQAEPPPRYIDQLDAVLSAAEVGKFACIAMLDAAPGAIEYAVANPDRVSHLILYNGTARLTYAEGYDIGMDPDVFTEIISSLAEGWATEAVARLSVPSRIDDERFVAWYTKYQRSIGTPTELSRRLREMASRDVRPLLDKLTVPTLVIHRRDYALIPRSHGEYLAEHISHADYAELPGADGPLYWESPEDTLRLIERFIVGTDPQDRSPRVVLALLFTDIAGSTERAEALGDRDWLSVLAQHDEVSAGWAAQFGGWVVKGTGDGVLAAFTNPTDAVHAAVAIRDALASMSVVVRTGIHAGEVRRSGDEVSGLGVHIANRVMAAAQPGEILVSRTVRDLMAGTNVQFAHAGTHELRGLHDAWELYRVQDSPE